MVGAMNIPGPWLLNTSHCPNCKKTLPDKQARLDNVQAKQILGSSGARHYCPSCRPFWAARMRNIAKEALRCQAILKDFIQDHEDQGLNNYEVAQEFSKLMRGGSISPSLVYHFTEKSGR